MLGKGHAVLLRRAELKTFVNFHGNEVINLGMCSWVIISWVNILVFECSNGTLSLSCVLWIFLLLQSPLFDGFAMSKIYVVLGWKRWRFNSRRDYYYCWGTWIDWKDSKRCHDSYIKCIFPWSGCDSWFVGFFFLPVLVCLSNIIFPFF